MSGANGGNSDDGGIRIGISNEQTLASSEDEIVTNPRQGDRRPANEVPGFVMPLGFLLSVMRDPHVPATLRLRVARTLAPYIHARPNAESGETISVDDRTGFRIDLATAIELRDIQLQYKSVVSTRQSQPEQFEQPKQFDQEAAGLEERIAEITRDLHAPCPSKYDEKKLERDEERLRELERLRQSGRQLKAHENIEEAWLTARVASYLSHPEIAASRRLRDLDARRWAGDRWNKEPPLRACERAEFRALEILYARPRKALYNMLKDQPARFGGPNMLALYEAGLRKNFENAV